MRTWLPGAARNELLAPNARGRLPTWSPPSAGNQVDVIHGRRGRESHPVRSLDPEQVEAPGDHALRRETQPQPERLGGVAEHAAVVVEAMEVVGESDRVRRQELRAAAIGGFAHRHGK